ncbi:hypothetical protein C7N43_23410 [Sphingobacteriales bacterium UPWRP_1]|nr:hypothetical protein B6N25_15540 [Sphingobacteriales bacterium TSM_CSS]PSJ74530.1 hypothetical protein C7N43_23410 [Sphingobacteriales bacterium UPWRP_1]
MLQYLFIPCNETPLLNTYPLHKHFKSTFDNPAGTSGRVYSCQNVKNNRRDKLEQNLYNLNRIWR